MKKMLIGLWFLIAGLAQAAESTREPKNLFDLIQNFNASPGRSHTDQYKVYYERYKRQLNRVIVDEGIKYYPLSLAIKKKDPEIIAKLVKMGAHVDGFLPYDAKSMRILLRAGANPNARCETGACMEACRYDCVGSILHLAVCDRSLEVVKELLKGGADTNSSLEEAKEWERCLLNDIPQLRKLNYAADLEHDLQELEFVQK